MESNSERVTIKSTWAGVPLSESDQIHVSLSVLEHCFEVSVDAPYYADPAPSGEPNCERLWDHEVVEVFLKGKHDKYVEFEMGPHGHFLILACDSYRQCFVRRLDPLQYHAEILSDGPRWKGVLQVPFEFLPPSTELPGSEFSINAYAIHGAAPHRVHCAAFPPAKAEGCYFDPDFHRLELFSHASVIGAPLAARVGAQQAKSIWDNRRALSMSYSAGCFTRE